MILLFENGLFKDFILSNTVVFKICYDITFVSSFYHKNVSK